MKETEPTIDDGDDKDLYDKYETEDNLSLNNNKQTTDTCLSAQRCRKIQALFQTMYYVHHGGRKRTPMHIKNAVSAHNVGHGGKILTIILNCIERC